MVVLDKAAVDRHRNDEEVKRYVVTLLRLVSVYYIVLSCFSRVHAGGHLAQMDYSRVAIAIADNSFYTFIGNLSSSAQRYHSTWNQDTPSSFQVSFVAS